MPKTTTEPVADSTDGKVDGPAPTSEGLETDEVPIEGTIGEKGFLQSSDTPVASPDDDVSKTVTDPNDDKSVVALADERQQVKKKEGAVTTEKPPKVEGVEGKETVDTSLDEQIVGSDGKTRPRHAHYQREMQLAQNANAVLLDERKGFESAKVIADAVIGNPTLTAQVQAQLKGQPIDSATESQKALSEKPKAPQMPVGYSLNDAQNDPESASATYFNEMINYPVKIEAWREEKETHDNAALRAESEQVEFNRIQANIKQGLLNEIRVNPATKDLNHAEMLAKVQEFYSDKEALTPQVLVNTFLSANKVEQGNSQETDAQRRAKELKGRADRVVAPVPAAVVTDDTVETVPNAVQDYARHISSNILAKPDY